MAPFRDYSTRLDSQYSKAGITFNSLVYTTLLDDYPPDYMWSLVQGLSSQSGSSLIQVQRQSDNTTANIGIVNGELDIATLTAFCTGTNCRVREWKDGTGGGSVATQSAFVNMPKIWDSATGLVKDAADRPMLNFAGSHRLLIPTIPANSALSIYTVFNIQSNATATSSIDERILGDTTGNVAFEVGTESGRFGFGHYNTSWTDYLTTATINDGSTHLGVMLRNSLGNYKLGIDNGAFDTGSISINSLASLNVIGDGFATYGPPLNGDLLAIYVYLSDQSLNDGFIRPRILDSWGL